MKSDCSSERDILTDLDRIDNSKGDKTRIEETHQEVIGRGQVRKDGGQNCGNDGTADSEMVN